MAQCDDLDNKIQPPRDKRQRGVDAGMEQERVVSPVRRILRAAGDCELRRYGLGMSDDRSKSLILLPGSGVMVYGLCSNTRQDFGNDYGEATADVDTFPHDVGDSSDGGIFQTRPYIADDCLMYFSAFAQGVHNLTYDSNRDNVFLSRFEVLSLDGSGGGTGSSNSQGGVSTPTGSGGSSGGSSAGSGGSSLGAGNSTVGLGDGTDSVAKALGISIGAIVGIVVTVIGVVVLACIACCLVCRRRRRATAVYINNAGGPSMTQQNAKQETPSASQTALPVQSYAAPSVPPPAPFQMQAQTQPGGTYAPPTGPPPAAARKPVPPARTLSMASRSSAWSSHGSQATERPRAVSNAHGPPQPYAISTTVPTAPSTVSPSSTTPDGSHEDPYAGMASYHPDPFAFAGRGMVLSADGVYTYDDPAALNKMRNERAGARVNRVGESSGSTSMPPAASGSAGVESAQEDAPPPVYEETQAPTRV